MTPKFRGILDRRALSPLLPSLGDTHFPPIEYFISLCFRQHFLVPDGLQPDWRRCRGRHQFQRLCENFVPLPPREVVEEKVSVLLTVGKFQVRKLYK